MSKKDKPTKETKPKKNVKPTPPPMRLVKEDASPKKTR